MPTRAFAVLLLLLAWVVCLGTEVSADTIWRSNGTKLVGKIVQEEETRVQIEVKRGTLSYKIWVPRSEITLLQKGRTPLEELREREAQWKPEDLDGLRRLIDFAERKQLLGELERLKKLVPAAEQKQRKAKNPKRWCRSCNAVGEVVCEECVGTGQCLLPCERCEAGGTIQCTVCGHRDNPGKLRCRKCNGAGKYERFNPAKGRKEKTRCPDCKGKGTHECPQCDGKAQQKCPVCVGEKGTKEDCKVCNQAPVSTCNTCKGAGLQPTPVTDEQLAQERKAAAEAAKQKDAEKAKGKPSTGQKSGGNSKDKPAARSRPR